jgi:hypothetical protein
MTQFELKCTDKLLELFKGGAKWRIMSQFAIWRTFQIFMGFRSWATAFNYACEHNILEFLIGYSGPSKWEESTSAPKPGDANTADCRVASCF